MARSAGKKRKAPGAGVWKKVDVGLAEDAAGDEDDNHYDSRDLQRRADKDLEAAPGEEMGFFLGLEVIDGNDYRVEKRNGSQIMIIKDKEPETDPKEDKDVATTEKETKKSKKKRKKKDKDSANETSKAKEDANNDGLDLVKEDATEAEQSVEAKKPKKKKKKNSKNSNGDEPDTISDQKKDSVDESEIARMQTAWMSQTGGVTLHQEICKSLFRQDFWTPTPIQAGCLPAAILGRRNIVGAAPTGSGKTLAFLIPIFQTLLDEEDSRGGDGDESNQPLKALILTPTRELAKQIFAECEKLARRRTALVVGGLAHVKQKRLLSRRPPIVVGTPGRLWEMDETQLSYKSICIQDEDILVVCTSV
eukprot:scaffold108_cov162-Amphora_coffeaeformis.AAC.21